MKHPLLPDRQFRDVLSIRPETLKKMGVRAILSDLDNTLAEPHAAHPRPAVSAWIRRMEDSGIRVHVVSNNRRRSRVERFCRGIGRPIRWQHMALKPLPFGMLLAMRRMRCRPAETVVLGDQLFTDVLAARLCGARALLVRPIREETSFFFRIKRRLERKLLKPAV